MMKAVFFHDGTAELIETPDRDPGPGEALVKVSMAGICQTDIELFSGYYDFRGIPGHEFAGVVVQAPGRPDLTGRRVTADINIGCGRCPLCKAGKKKHCLERKVIGIKKRDGAFAEYLAVPFENLHGIGESISDEDAVFAEPLAAALQISQQIHLTAEKRIAVLGDGKIGLLAALGLSRFSPGLTLIGRHRRKLAVARNHGVNTVETEAGEPSDDVAARAGSFDVVVEATGCPDGIRYALALVQPGGVIAAKTTSRLESAFDLSRLVVNEVTLVGSRCGDLSLALHFLKNRWVPVGDLLDAVYPLEAFGQAFAHARQKGAGKILLTCSSDSKRHQGIAD